MKRIILAMLLFLCPYVSAAFLTEGKEGNLAFPTSQEPSPLFSLGQNIVDKKDLLALATFEQNGGHMRDYISLIPSVLYGITDDLSILGYLPIVFEYKQDDHGKLKRGIGDLTLQAEWAFYNNDQPDRSYQATFVGNIGLPTGAWRPDKPNLGLANVSFLLGGTFSYLSANWYAFISGGALLTTTRESTKYGNQFFYEAGAGYRLGTIKNWLFNIILEFNGAFYQSDKLCGSTDHTSGGNVIYLGPSLYAATYDHFIFIAGAQFPITQSLMSVFKTDWRYSIYGAWKF